MGVDPITAGRILDRLKAHYPNLAANDQASRDWLTEICLTPDPGPIAEWMISEWSKDRGPRISDWVWARRTSVHQAQVSAGTDTLAIEAPVKAQPARVRALLSDAAKQIAVGQLDEMRAPLVDHDRDWTPLRYPDGGGGLAVRPLTYDEVYAEPEDADV